MKRVWKFSLYQKFAAVIICVGLVPMVILSGFVMNRMLTEYENSLKNSYEQMTAYANSSVDLMLESYNEMSKMPYYYNYSSDGSFAYNYKNYDNFRKNLYGLEDEPGREAENREKRMSLFLQNVHNVDSSVAAVHFVADNEIIQECFHYSARNSYLQDEALFRKRLRTEQVDKESKKLQLIATHQMDYYKSSSELAFTVARNYFDLTKPVGETEYIGTIYIDIQLERLKSIFQNMKLGKHDQVYVLDAYENCFYSSDPYWVGRSFEENLDFLRENDEQIVIETVCGKYGLKVCVVMQKKDAFRQIRQLQSMVYGSMAALIVALGVGSVLFSKGLTRPISEMMEQMAEIENGNFQVKIPVKSKDEIGVLSQRFNQMSQELETYINKSYVAQIKQREAEMTALKSQIYPHFLYNTLEVIRMTALDNEDEKVSGMIEALSEQIRYIVGPVKDMVPLDMEAAIIRKYVYLLNCRMSGTIQLSIDLNGHGEHLVPKLILQPIVENAYKHGLKPRQGGNIMIDAEVDQDRFVISLMDNGVGMDSAALEKLYELLEGNEIGIKDEHNWQSIGLKNVHDRIRYLYGTPYGLEITSTVGVGTMIRIVMPVQER